MANADDEPSFADIARKLREEPGPFAEMVIGEKPTYRSGSEIRFYPNQSLVVNLTGKRKGTFLNFSDESQKGDMIDLWKLINGGSSHDALLAAQEYLRIGGVDLKGALTAPPRDPKISSAEDEAERQKKIRTARWIWDSSSPTEGKEEGLLYLKNRGIVIDPPADLMRFRRLSPQDLEKMNVPAAHIPKTPVVAIVLRATNAKGDTTAVQQILTSQGMKLSKIIPGFENDKRTNGDLSGSAVKFGGERPEEVVLAEGPETSLSIFVATGKPTWVTLGTANYTTLQMPKSVKRTIVAADLEPSGTGLASALRAAQFWDAAGVPDVGIAIPPKIQDGDFNDAHQKHGAEAVRAAIDGAFTGERNRAPGVVCFSPDARAAFHVWQKTGLETIVRVPGMNKDGKRWPISLESLIKEYHTKVLIIPREGYPIQEESFAKSRPGLPVKHLIHDSAPFLQNAKKTGYVESLVAQHTDIHAPSGLGTTEPLAFCLRRTDADALHDAGHKAIAVRSSGIELLDFAFMKGRKAIVFPVGTGTEADRKLETRLQAAGAQTSRVVWQIFCPEGDGFRIARGHIPETYGAAEAVAEGWKGERMGDLLKASEAALSQIKIPCEPEATVGKKTKSKTAER